MAMAEIRQSIDSVMKFFEEKPEKGRINDTAAVAVVEEGLRCRADGPNGAVLISDMPVVLTVLEVAVDSQSDDRGLLGVGGDSALPGPSSIRVRVRIAADDASPEQLREIVEWAEAHSPVAMPSAGAVSFSTEIEVA